LEKENGYSFFMDGNGKQYAIRKETGEITEAVTVTVPIGTAFITPEDRERRKNYAEKDRIKQLRRENSKVLGKFIFMSGTGFDKLSSASVARLIMLGTYCGYDDRLMVTERRQMTRKDAQDILELNDTAFFKFWKEIAPRFVKEKEGFLWLTDSCTFTRGKLNQKEHSHFWKSFIYPIRHLYRATKIRQHKHLGYIYQMLPFVNIEFNMLCHDVYENSLDHIQPMTLAEFCEYIDFDWSHLNRLLTIYRNITFDVNGHEERFCSIVNDGIDKRNAMIFINPHILYSGSNYEKVEVLGAFCKK